MNARQLAVDNEECHGNQWENNSLLQGYNEMKLAQTVKQTIYGVVVYLFFSFSFFVIKKNQQILLVEKSEN